MCGVNCEVPGQLPKSQRVGGFGILGISRTSIAGSLGNCQVRHGAVVGVAQVEVGFVAIRCFYTCLAVAPSSNLSRHLDAGHVFNLKILTVKNDVYVLRRFAFRSQLVSVAIVRNTRA